MTSREARTKKSSAKKGSAHLELWDPASCKAPSPDRKASADRSEARTVCLQCKDKSSSYLWTQGLNPQPSTPKP
jgi:hypothetical protein